MRYELFHDVLTEPILEWRRGYEQRRARRRWAAIGAALVALVAVFAGLGVWALIERGHAQSRANALYADNTSIEQTNTVLTNTKRKLTEELKTKNAKTSKKLAALTTTNESLRREVASLTDQRSALAAENESLEKQNRALVSGIHRLNEEDKGLAATIYRLRRGYSRMHVRLAVVHNMHGNLTEDVGILKTERRSLKRQLRAANKENGRLAPIAAALGYPMSGASPTTGNSSPSPPLVKRAPAHQFPTPGELKTYDTLRKKVAALQRKLDDLESRQARIGLLRHENRLLRQQLVALRTESTKLAATQTKLEARKRRLAVIVVAARHEHTRLRAQADVAQIAFRTEARKLARRTRTDSVLQSKDNGRVRDLGSQQERLAGMQSANGKLVAFLSKVTNQLVQAAESSPIAAGVAGLLAVEAFRVTPYEADATAHPGPYNALWVALDRLDPSAAAALIAPVPSRTGKIGTTRSSLLKQKLCGGLVSGAITKATWAQYVHVAGARYPLSPLDYPCGK
jgi:hypothetical protein